MDPPVNATANPYGALLNARGFFVVSVGNGKTKSSQASNIGHRQTTLKPVSVSNRRLEI
jgi:hypothetical protein